MFASPSFRVFNQAGENKDALMARKPGISNSARKPLADRSVNESKLPKPDLIKPKPNKIAPSAKKANPKQEYPDLLIDVCSFKAVEDTYEDIWPKSQRLNKYDFINIVQQKTPPLKSHIEIDPMFLELPPDDFCQFRDEIVLEKYPVDDVEFPDFDPLILI